MKAHGTEEGSELLRSILKEVCEYFGDELKQKKKIIFLVPLQKNLHWLSWCS